ncbi:antioxidant, AhpC/TSA family [Bacteroidales bacterium KA00344]|nr:antioxidant, AhpC/TSA family [Bacteroidales bacterium KA00344]
MHKQLLFWIVTILSLASCGVDDEHFKMEGRILNMNQGEFYVYDNMGLIDGLDTIKVEGGRFIYEMKCERPTTVMLIFPNFSEQPIFAESGKSVSIKGNASHLKALKVKGTRDNELMSEFRAQIYSASPPEVRKYASQFVEDHPASPVAMFLIKKYFITATAPDYREANRLITLISPKQATNPQFIRISKLIRTLEKGIVNNTLPTFTGYDMHGKLVSSSDLSNGLAVINTWATWNYESMNQLRDLKRLQKQSKGRLKLLSISIDASRQDSKKSLDRDSISWPNICDGKMFEGKVIQQLGMMNIPDNMVIQNGKIIARSLSTQDLCDKIEKSL